jgi:hypothetical protein
MMRVVTTAIRGRLTWLEGEAAVQAVDGIIVVSTLALPAIHGHLSLLCATPHRRSQQRLYALPCLSGKQGCTLTDRRLLA